MSTFVRLLVQIIGKCPRLLQLTVVRFNYVANTGVALFRKCSTCVDTESCSERFTQLRRQVRYERRVLSASHSCYLSC